MGVWIRAIVGNIVTFFGTWLIALEVESHRAKVITAIVGLVVGLVVIAASVIVERRKRSQTQDESPPQPYVVAKDSADWTWKDTTVSGDRPFVEAENSPGWELEGTTLGDDAEPQAPPEEADEERPEPQ